MPERPDPFRDRVSQSVVVCCPDGSQTTCQSCARAFIDEGIKLAKQRGYNPTIFVGMRHQYGTVDAIERLVQSGDIQSGFKRLNQLNLLDWTIESAVTKFPAEFSHNAKQCEGPTR